MADRLVAWFYDTPVAVLMPGAELRIRLEWRAEGIERWRLGSPVLSVGLPIGTPVGPQDMRGLDFFENMLPEGPALARMAAVAEVRPADTYGILRAFGRDCAGAVMMLPEGERPGDSSGSGQADIRKVTAANLIGEGVTWGIGRRAASTVVTETLEQVMTAIPATPGDERVLAVIRGQAERVRRG